MLEKGKKFDNLEMLEDYLDENAIDMDFNEVGEYLESYGWEFSDSWVDNGGDEEGEYVIGRSYKNDKSQYINLYYSNYNPNVGCIEVYYD